MSTLGAVEEIHRLFLLWRRRGHVGAVGVHFGVHYSCRAPEAADADAMPHAELDGRVRMRLGSGDGEEGCTKKVVAAVTIT